MTVNKSILESVELESGAEFYIQFSGVGNSATISFDGPVANFAISLKSAEVDKIIEALQKAKGEADAN